MVTSNKSFIWLTSESCIDVAKRNEIINITYNIIIMNYSVMLLLTCFIFIPDKSNFLILFFSFITEIIAFSPSWPSGFSDRFYITITTSIYISN